MVQGSRWVPVLVIVLAVGGLLVMHGLAASGHRTAAHDHGQLAHAAPGAAMSDHAAAATTATGAADAADHHGALGHVMAMCLAVLAVAAGGNVLRRMSLRPSAVVAAVPAVAGVRTWVHRTLDELRQPAPDRLALCILRI